jgi:hypothetical protein
MDISVTSRSDDLPRAPPHLVIDRLTLQRAEAEAKIAALEAKLDAALRFLQSRGLLAAFKLEQGR